MKLAIISRSPACYSTKRLVAAATRRGHQVQVVDPLRCSFDVRPGSGLLLNTKPLSQFDAAIPRIGSSIHSFGIAVVRQLEQSGVLVANSSDAITASRDIHLILRTFASHRIPIPDSMIVRSRGDIIPMVDRMGGPPVVIKVIEGARTIAEVPADTIEVVEAILAAVQPSKQFVLIHRFVSASEGRSIRAVVIGDAVVGAVVRASKESSVRTVKLDSRCREIAIRAAEVMGLGIAGIDMLETGEVLGVCSSPGLRAIEQATDLDIADDIIHYVAAQAEFPNADRRQRKVSAHSETL